MQRTNLSDSANVETRRIDFGLVDERGRAIGVLVTTYEVDATPVPAEQRYGGYDMEPGHYFVAYVHATRNGEHFGALQRSGYFTTERMRDAYVADRVAAARKRYTRLAAKAGA